MRTLLLEFCDLDKKLLYLLAERKRAKEEMATRVADLKGIQALIAERNNTLVMAEKRYANEELKLRDTKVKIESRKNEVATLGNYKIQEAALREIALNEKQLTLAEDSLLEILDKIEQGRHKIATLTAELRQKSEKVEKLQINASEAEEIFQRREDEYRESQNEVRKKLSPEILQEYERAKIKQPMDPIAELRGNACNKCLCKIRPQVALDIQHQGKPARCPNCGRLIIASVSKE
jgi:predicted  nucleic acid-binding Zn-ribbon protein